MKKIVVFIFFLVGLLIGQIGNVSAHPGRTDSSGCHTCRTNCEDWGLSYGEYHCHGGSEPSTPTAPKPDPVPVPKNCPINSTYSNARKTCECDGGYASSINKQVCVKIPEHAYPANDKINVWLCGAGYQEKSGSCVPVEKEDCEVDMYATTISRAVDGDTVEFDCNGVSEKIRIIGIDTPETVHPSKPVQCFGKEASDKMKNLVTGKKVILRKGQGSDNRDKYGRLLRYVEIDKKDIGMEMVKEGFAFSYKSYPHEKLDEYNQLEKTARENEKGLWGKDVCDYQEEIVKNIEPTTSTDTVKSQPEKKESLFSLLKKYLKSLFK